MRIRVWSAEGCPKDVLKTVGNLDDCDWVMRIDASDESKADAFISFVNGDRPLPHRYASGEAVYYVFRH